MIIKNLPNMQALNGMRRDRLILSMTMVILIAAVLWVCVSEAQATTITNPGFEADSGWTITQNSISAYYATDWSSEGTRNFTFYRGTGSISAGAYAMISQDIDMTDVTGFLFDCQDTGIDAHPLNFLIDDIVVGTWQNNGHEEGDTSSSWGHTVTSNDISIDLSMRYAGVHELSIQMYNDWNFGPADPKVYRVDNLRVALDEYPEASSVPEPANILLLGTGLIGLVGLGKRKMK